jgi:pyridoxal phosphate enzyme (YggS family)
VAVTKAAPEACFGSLLRAGVTDVGENRVHAAARRRPGAPAGLRWHGIGHLQRNKIPEALATFDVFHALDSLRLAQGLERHLAPAGRRWPVLVQVNASAEEQKGGLGPEEASAFLAEILTRCPHLQVTGWMTMAAFGASEGDLRRTFRTLRALRDEVRGRGLGDPPPGELSMGMSDDFEIAIEEGATVVRVGRALFQGVPADSGSPQGEAGDAA